LKLSKAHNYSVNDNLNFKIQQVARCTGILTDQRRPGEGGRVEVRSTKRLLSYQAKGLGSYVWDRERCKDSGGR
jgi:hypothetical protein